MPASNSLLFILGIQRSGTTWLANIFDASPDVLMFMEPFAPAYGLFPEFPETSFFLQSAPAKTTRVLKEEMQSRLYRRKFLFNALSERDPRLFRFERGIARLSGHVDKFLPRAVTSRMRQFSLLNLNRFDPTYPLSPKNKNPRHCAIKELRLAGKIPLLQAAFPEARYLVIIRHPVATVHSILKWFSRGRLGELQQDLDTFVEKLEVQSVGSEYKRFIAASRSDDIVRRSALYWRVSYETMVRQLEETSRFRLLPYEALASQPMEIARDLFSWAEIPWSPNVTDYIDFSSGTGAKTLSPTDTVRHSRTYFSSWQQNIDKELMHAVGEIVDDSFLMAHFKAFYESHGKV